MQCSRCGYMMGPFDRTCPCCVHLAQTGQQPPTSAPYPGSAGQAPIPAPGAMPWIRLVVAAGTALLVLLALVLIVLNRPPSGLPSGGSGAGSGLLLVPSGSLPSGGGLAGSVFGVGQIDQRLLQAGAQTGGELDISLAWNSLTDLDLSVSEPGGELICASHRQSASGGVQDVDANPTLVTEEGKRLLALGRNPGPGNILPLTEFMVDLEQKMGLPEGMSGLGSGMRSHFTHTPVEHIYFSQAPKGTYRIYARCYSWREPDQNPLTFTLLIRSRGKVFYQTVGTLGPASYVTDNLKPMQVCQFVLK